MRRLRRRRSSLRPRGFDYTQPGAYFVTLVTSNREVVFDDARFKRIAEACWHWLGEHFSEVVLDEFVIMPNHLHGILIVNGSETSDPPPPRRRPSRRAPTAEGHLPPQKAKPVGRLVGAFKTVSTSRINQLRGTPGALVWQRNFFDRVARSEAEMERIRQYIYDNNPVMWEQDPENPNAGAAASSQKGPSPL